MRLFRNELIVEDRSAATHPSHGFRLDASPIAPVRAVITVAGAARWAVILAVIAV